MSSLDVMLLKQQARVFTASGANSRQEQAFEYAFRRSHRDFEFGCADGPGQGIGTRRGSHVYEINAWLWNFGRPQPRVGGLSVAKTEKISWKVESAASRSGWKTRKARKLSAQADAEILHEYS